MCRVSGEDRGVGPQLRCERERERERGVGGAREDRDRPTGPETVGAPDRQIRVPVTGLRHHRQGSLAVHDWVARG